MHTHRTYFHLALMFVLHVAAMYVLMYAMVESTSHIRLNNNQLYMAVLMASPMLLLELLLMRSMYKNRDLNFIIFFAGLVLLIGSFFLVRAQAAVGDEQLLKSMIPHHSSAILMCRNAALKDAQVKELCGNILSGQQAEIDWMGQKLDTLDP